MMFGRKTTLFIDIKIQPIGLYYDPWFDFDNSDIDRAMAEYAKINIEKAHTKQKHNYDWTHANPKFYQAGAKVLNKMILQEKIEKVARSMMDHTSL